jgi:hypothetical protein
MAGTRLRCILHDGKKVVDNRPVARQFNGMRVQDFTKRIYRTDSDKYDTKQVKGEEIVEIEGIRKDSNSGFQVYLALMKGDEALEMGLPGVNRSKEDFPNAAQLRINMDELEAALGHLPDDVELAIVWRLDKNMTQDIVITENSMISRPVPIESADGFSLLDKKPPVGCGGGIGGDGDAVYDLTEVFIYTGERDDPIRLSNTVMAAPPEAMQWGASDSFTYVQPPMPLDGIAKQRPADRQRASSDSVTDFTLRMCWQDDMDSNEVSVEPMILHRQPETQGPGISPAPSTFILIVCSEDPKESKRSPEFKEEENPIIRLIMNPTERRLWGKLYGFPDEDVGTMPPKVTSPMPQKVHPMKDPSPVSFCFRQLPVLDSYVPKKATAEPPKPSILKQKAMKTSLKCPKPVPDPAKGSKPSVARMPSAPKTRKAQKRQQRVRQTASRGPEPRPAKRKKQKKVLEKPTEQRAPPKRKSPKVSSRSVTRAENLRSKTEKKARRPEKIKTQKPTAEKRKPSVKPRRQRKSATAVARPPVQKNRKRAPRKEVPSYFKKGMLGLYKGKKVSGRTRARSSR